MHGQIDTTNRYGVARRGHHILITAPPGIMSIEDALVYAAWIVSLADPGGEHFTAAHAAVQPP